MLQHSKTRAAAAAAACALVLAACGGGDDDAASGSDGGSEGGGESAGSVGVILPDATTSPRWEANDRPLLQEAFEAAGIDADIQNANGDIANSAPSATA